jgi:hypothetical protein
MTLSPSDDRNISGVEGPEYPLNQRCPVPGCEQPGGLQRHHLWRRSDLGGDYWWVKSDDRFVGNCIKLCRYHHRELTDNQSRIRFDGLTFTWKDAMLSPMELLWQPPIRIEGLEIPDPPAPRHDHASIEPGDVCPTCFRKVPLPRTVKFDDVPKLRKTWCVAVPEQSWGDGADAIGTLLEEARREMTLAGLPYGESDVAKFHVLTHVLALFVQHAHKIMSDD